MDDVVLCDQLFELPVCVCVLIFLLKAAFMVIKGLFGAINLKFRTYASICDFNRLAPINPITPLLTF